MDKLIFGMQATPDTTADNSAFVENKAMAAGAGNGNPYGDAYLRLGAYMNPGQTTKITSIPSPYARMHLTDIAFREYNAGHGTWNQTELAKKTLNPDYTRAISHCLDMFEIIYRFGDINLRETGITAQILNLTTVNTYVPQGNKDPMVPYLKALEMFRTSYIDTINERKSAAGVRYEFDFTKLYTFRYNGTVFGATSPFTGFFTVAGCDLDAAIKVNTRKLLSNDPESWCLPADRDSQFLDFMYLLLNDSGLDKIFINLFQTIKLYSPIGIAGTSTESFATRFKDFNITPTSQQLPTLQTRNPQNQVHLRPNGLDSVYLKYLLFIEKPFDFELDINDFKQAIDNRKSPDGLSQMKWVTVNDLLADMLVVLPYDIDRNYEAIEYTDTNLVKKRRCLIPLKREALKYLDLKQLIKGLDIQQYTDGHFTVTIALTMTTGGTIKLARDYWPSNSENRTWPNGVLISDNETSNFAFGIYPFAKSPCFDNIYKVLFHNSFNKLKWDLNFFWLSGNNVNEFTNGSEVTYKTTSDMRQDIPTPPISSRYFNVNCGKNADRTKEVNVNVYNHNTKAQETKTVNTRAAIDFAELTLIVPDVLLDGNGEPLEITGTALIVPNLRVKSPVDVSETTVAIDLGTSNTYVAYHHKIQGTREAQLSEICTLHNDAENGDWNELEFLSITRPNNNSNDFDPHIDDLYLPTGSRDKEWGNMESLVTQLSEFIPSRIRPQDKPIPGYCFPIPTVINTLRKGQNTNSSGDLPLVDSAIPFAYYTQGKRNMRNGVILDNIEDGKFKWFYDKDNDGNYTMNQIYQRECKAFIGELMFILRSHFICQGYDLDRVKLIWTYPLSFQPELVKVYKDTWEEEFIKYFRPDWKQGQMLTIPAGRSLDNEVPATNESLSPYYDIDIAAVYTEDASMLVDIGGGSSDIIVYKDNAPQYVSSFNFAGNSLYLGGTLNNKGASAKNNIFKPEAKRAVGEVLQTPKEQFAQANNPISWSDDIVSIMNYGFSQRPDDFVRIFNNQIPKFMLHFHNSALIYHLAQLAHAMDPVDPPSFIYFTGNGSKLLKMNPEIEKFINQAFSAIYGKDIKINAKYHPNPKTATVRGALKGEYNNTIAFGNDANRLRAIMVGDSQTVGLAPDQYGLKKDNYTEQLDAVRDNVLQFVKMFYSTLPLGKNPVEISDMEKFIDKASEAKQVKNTGPYLTDSMFFQYISIIMERMSAQLYEKLTEDQKI